MVPEVPSAIDNQTHILLVLSLLLCLSCSQPLLQNDMCENFYVILILNFAYHTSMLRYFFFFKGDWLISIPCHPLSSLLCFSPLNVRTLPYRIGDIEQFLIILWMCNRIEIVFSCSLKTKIRTKTFTPVGKLAYESAHSTNRVGQKEWFSLSFTYVLT